MADRIMDEIWDRREEAGTRLRAWGRLGKRHPMAARARYGPRKPMPPEAQAVSKALFDLMSKAGDDDER